MRKHVFGPILSRRLGTSLGVDLVMPKTCPLDCIYCEARATTLLTMERKEYVPIDEVLAELDETLAQIPPPDYVTFSGAGEPTLNSGIGRVVDHLVRHHPSCRICLLTNGLLLGDPQVQKEVGEVDLAIPSLDASSEEEYRIINRPVAGETLEKLVAGLADFRRHFRRRMALEIFLVPGVNDSDASLARFVRLVGSIAPDAVQLNSLDRPGVLETLRPAPPETLRRFADALAPVTEVEIVRPLKKEAPARNGGADDPAGRAR